MNHNSSQIREVTHETRYEYDSPAECSQQICILQPQEGPTMAEGLLRKGQRLLDYRLQIQPNPSMVQSSCDSFGNVVHHFEMNYPHDSLSVMSLSKVEVVPMLYNGPLEELNSPSWFALAQSMNYLAGQAAALESQFRFESRHVPILNALRDYSMLDFWPDRPVVQAAYALMQRIHREFTYESGSTSIDTPILTVMDTRKGVCQDFAHVMLGVLRAIGLCARYVSGYMLTDPPPGQSKLMGADASHAWVSLWCGPEIGWVDFDPTNNQLPDTRYVTVAVGRDYADVPPIRGVVHGGGAAKLSVAVTVF